MKYFLTMLLLTAIFSAFSFAQKDTVVVPGYFEMGGQEGTLNDAVQEKINAGTVSNTVFKLKLYDVYVLTSTLDLSKQPGDVLEIVADPPGNTQETAPPMICWTADNSPSKTYLFDIAGTLKLKNIWILWASLGGSRFTSTIRIGDSATVAGGRIEADNVIFDYVQQASSGAIQPYATHFNGFFNNCYFRNCTDNHFRYYSRAISVPYDSKGLHIDSLSFENCTFANIGYVYMQEQDVYGDNVYFNHCTFYNVLMFTLESGNWHNMFVTNSLFENTHMLGRIPASDNEGFGGTINIAPLDSGALGTGWGFTPDWNPKDGIRDFEEQDRHILFANNSYHIEQWIVDWMRTNPYSDSLRKARRDELIPLPHPMLNGNTRKFFDSTNSGGSKAFPYMNSANLDSVDPGVVFPPINLDSLKTFMYYKWLGSGDLPWEWNASQYTNNGGQVWPLAEDLSYTNEKLKTAAMGGFPLGDLRWWPEQYTAWKAQEDIEHSRISTWLQSGNDPVSVIEVPGTVPGKYILNQNYPNPFNPVTEINYSIPVQGDVSLKVFNSLGQEVATIFKGFQQAGNYSATFDASALSSGIYFYRLQAGNMLLTKKLVLMK
jgi:hypothetical protein